MCNMILAYIYVSLANLRICRCSSENSCCATFAWLGELAGIISFVNLLSQLHETSFFSRLSIPLARVIRSRACSCKYVTYAQDILKPTKIFLSYKFRDKFEDEFFSFGNFVSGLFISKKNFFLNIGNTFLYY